MVAASPGPLLARVAQVAPRAVAADAAADRVACVATVLPELLPEGRDLLRAAVERPVTLRRPGGDRPPQVVRRRTGERRPAGADRGGRVGVAVADPRKTELVGEPDD